MRSVNSRMQRRISLGRSIILNGEDSVAVFMFANVIGFHLWSSL